MGEYWVARWWPESQGKNLKLIILTGQRISLGLFRIDHTPSLALAGLHTELCSLQPAQIAYADSIRRYGQTTLENKTCSSGRPFVVLDLTPDQVTGGTRYMDIAPAHFRLGIGAKWLTLKR